MQKVTGKQSIYLVDDLPAELDSEHRYYLCRVLEKMQCQVFITSVEADALTNCWSASTPMTVFHVKHGQLDHTPGPDSDR